MHCWMGYTFDERVFNIGGDLYFSFVTDLVSSASLTVFLINKDSVSVTHRSEKALLMFFSCGDFDLDSLILLVLYGIEVIKNILRSIFVNHAKQLSLRLTRAIFKHILMT